MGGRSFLKIHPQDNVLVALKDLPEGTIIRCDGRVIVLRQEVKAKHKFTLYALSKDAEVYMYGVVVGKVNEFLEEGSLLTVDNLRHATGGFHMTDRKLEWQKPDVTRFKDATFLGYHRSNGQVGTANYWLVIPLVFCENRNVNTLKEALEEKLGYAVQSKDYSYEVDLLIEKYKKGATVEELLQIDFSGEKRKIKSNKLFENVDGIKFLTHEFGCGGTRQDSDALCGLLAGYITHPNVAGATVLSLGCQHAQVSILRAEIEKRDPHFDKPLYIFEHQQEGTEDLLMQKALKATFCGLVFANSQVRQPAPLSKLCIGLECGG